MNSVPSLNAVRSAMVSFISSLHTTTGLVLNEIEGALLSDMTTLFEQLVPRGVYYKHNDPLLTGCARKNADAHLRALVVGHSLSIPVEDGRLRLGTWQRVLLASSTVQIRGRFISRSWAFKVSRFFSGGRPVCSEPGGAQALATEPARSTETTGPSSDWLRRSLRAARPLPRRRLRFRMRPLSARPDCRLR
jgi:secondary thiamine-phosphate synthase enzyme